MLGRGECHTECIMHPNVTQHSPHFSFTDSFVMVNPCFEVCDSAAAALSQNVTFAGFFCRKKQIIFTLYCKGLCC